MLLSSLLLFFSSSSANAQTDTALLYNTHPDSCTHMDRTGLESILSLRNKNSLHCHLDIIQNQWSRKAVLASVPMEQNVLAAHFVCSLCDPILRETPMPFVLSRRGPSGDLNAVCFVATVLATTGSMHLSGEDEGLRTHKRVLVHPDLAHGVALVLQCNVAGLCGVHGQDLVQSPRTS